MYDNGQYNGGSYRYSSPPARLGGDPGDRPPQPPMPPKRPKKK